MSNHQHHHRVQSTSTSVMWGVVVVVIVIAGSVYIHASQLMRGNSPKNVLTTTPVDVSSSRPHVFFSEHFDTPYVLQEASSEKKSASPYWWLGSGGYFYSAKGLGSTVMGALPIHDSWRVAYLVSNTRDTDGGQHPQNIFRLVERGTWSDYKQEAYFNIARNDLSASPNRNESNGLLFFEHYQDSQNLYYTGIRVDGYAVIKKKIKGVYYTMAVKPFITGPAYDRDTHPNLLPQNVWIGLRSEVETDVHGSVRIRLYVDTGRTGAWILAAEAIDDGHTYGGGVLGAGHTGIRTDFMDVTFADYSLSSLVSN